MTKKILTTIALSAVLIAFNSCKKDDDGPIEPAQFMVVHSAPGAPAVELYLDDIKASTSATSFGNASTYNSIAAKQYNVKIAAVNSINPVAETTVNLDGGNNYSIFAYDTLLSGKVKLFSVQDDLTAPASGKAKIRFFHLAPEPVRVDIAANNTVLFPNRAYADNVTNGGLANFVTVDAGTYTFDVRLAGSNPAIPAIISVPGVTIEAGKIYTVIAKGRVNGTGDQALGAQLIVNK
jgi:hypothetical protein